MISPVSASATQKAQGVEGGSEDIQDRFLKMLVAQLKNQDPMNPMENSEVTSQMAQLNTVSGIENLNKTMGKIGDIIGAGQFAQSTSLLGKTVLVEGNSLALYSDQAFGQVTADVSFQEATMRVRDASGRVIREQSVGPIKAGENDITWDGLDNDGNQVPHGQYQFEVVGMQGEESVPLSTQTYARIESLDNKGLEGFVLTTSDGQEVSLNDVLKVI